MAEQRGAEFIFCTRSMRLASIFCGAPTPLAHVAYDCPAPLIDGDVLHLEPFRRLLGSESLLPYFQGGGVPIGSSCKRRLKDWVFCYFPPGWKAFFRRRSIDAFSR